MARKRHSKTHKKGTNLLPILLLIAGIVGVVIFYLASQQKTQTESEARIAPFPQKVRQLVLNNEGTKFYYRTCDWNKTLARAENCDPISSWKEYPVTEIVDPRTLGPGVPRIRDYNVFVFDGTDSQGRQVQKIRQAYINFSGTTAYYRTCVWNPDLAVPEKCSPQGQPWTAYQLSQIRVAEPPPYRKFASYVYDAVPGNTYSQKIRQVLLNNTGTKIYQRTCDWDPTRATPVNCGANPNLEGWTGMTVAEAIGSKELNPVPTTIREYSAFIYDGTTNRDTGSQKIRQFYFNEAGTTVYYRTCDWNRIQAKAENCTPANSWSGVNIAESIGQNSPTSYLGYNVFAFDVNPARQ